MYSEFEHYFNQILIYFGGVFMKKLLMPLIAMVCLFIGGSGLVLANNHGDTSWNVVLPAFQKSVYTGSRLKTDKTRSYAKLTQIGQGKVHVWTEKANGAAIDTGSYDLKQGQSVKIYNRAYEMYGRVNIKLGMHNAYFTYVSVHAKGVWSPDSI